MDLLPVKYAVLLTQKSDIDLGFVHGYWKLILNYIYSGVYILFSYTHHYILELISSTRGFASANIWFSGQ
jgi:hypothetical protein